MFVSRLLLVALSIAFTSGSPIQRRQFSYGSKPVRGANIGGWLVLEPWITPSIFQPFGGSVVDEYTLCQQSPNAESILQSHWASWTGLGDFQRLAGAGINLVRIPIGYWAFQKYGGDPYIQGAQEYLDQALGWARQTGLKVWIDLHGAPRSQNGFDNSGQLLAQPGWGEADSVSATEKIIGQIARKYASGSYNDVVAGIELLNEPQTSTIAGGRETVQGYYQAGFDSVRAAGSTPVIIQDGFVNPSSWNGFLSGQGWAIIDHHQYEVFTNSYVAMSPEAHAGAVYSDTSSFASGVDKYIVVGEWTAAMTDCAPALNGFGIGARYDGTYSKRNPDGSYDSSTAVGSCANINFIDQWSQYNKTSTTNFIRAQINAYESQTQGWIFWNFKTEAAAEWDLFRLMDAGVFPSLT